MLTRYYWHPSQCDLTENAKDWLEKYHLRLIFHTCYASARGKWVEKEQTHKNISRKTNDSYECKISGSRYMYLTDIKDFHIDSWVVVIFKAQTLRVPTPQHNWHWTHHHNKWWCLSQLPVDIRNGDKHVPLHCLCHQQIQTHGSQPDRRPLSISQRLDYLSRPFCHIQKASHRHWKPSQSHGDKGLKGLTGIERLVLLRCGAVVILLTHWKMWFKS